MAEIVGVAIEVGKLIAGPVKRQFNYLCCFNTNIQNLKDEAKKLDDAKEGVEGQVNADMNNIRVIKPEVETWLRNVSNIQEEMNGIETEIQNVKSGCLAVKLRFLLSRKATKMAVNMKKLKDDGKFEQISNPPPPPAMASSLPAKQTYEFESRKHFEEEIMATLKGKKVRMMGICGMGGLGKTTMAKKIMSRAGGENLFDEIVMVVVSQPVDMLRIQKDMAELLGLELKGESVAARAHQLRIRLTTNPKSILIILDDLWEALNLEEDLGIPDHKECTILLTSRVKDVFGQMRVEKPYQFQMTILSDIEALSLFKEKVGACADDQRLSPIAEKIAQECQGLPIALVTVGLALKDKPDKAIWENAVRELVTRNPEGIPNFLRRVYNTLKLSIDLLDNGHASSMLLLCCLFPEDHNIYISNLCRYTWGLDMFNRIPSVRDTRNKVQASVEMLKSRSLLLSYEGSVKMHDVVRDVGIFIAKKEGLMNPNCSRVDSNCTWISLFDAQKIELPEGSAFPKLQLSLIESTSYSSPQEEFPLSDNFFESVENLHVLSIKNYHTLRCLPHTIKMLKNLRSLILLSCSSLKDISIVGELVSLEILYFCECHLIKELPVEIGKLKKLKLLDIKGCRDLKRIAAGVISKLISLEELTLLLSFSEWESGASEGGKNAALCELNYLSSLTTLRIEIKDTSLAAEEIHLPNLVEFTICIGSTKRRRTVMIWEGREMRLKLERDVNIGDWIYQLLRTTERLGLEGEGSSKLVPLLPQFQSLERLKILGNEKVTRFDGRSSGPATSVFPVLEFLCLEGIDDLEEIHKGPISSDSFKYLKEIRLVRLPKLQQLWNVVLLFCNLSSIYIDECHSLRRLFPWGRGDNSLLQLKSLEIKSCSMLEVMWGEEDGKEIGQSSGITFPKLEELILDDLPRLTSFCKGIQSIEFPLLTEMKIMECPDLKSLVSSTEENDHICSGVVNDAHQSLHLFCKSKVVLGRLKDLTIGGGGYENTSNERSWSLWCDQIPVDFFTGLVNLTVFNCDSINNLFSVSIAKNLVNLRKLSIESCSEMVKVVEDKVDDVERSPFINLEELELKDLPKLKVFCDWSCALQLPSLKNLNITVCPELEQVMLWNEEEEENGESSSRITFPKLEQLILGNLPRLTSFCKGIQSIEFPLLTLMEIVECPNLKRIVSSTENDHICSGVVNDAHQSLHLFCKSKVAFGRLEILAIDGYDSISSLWCDQIPIDFFTGLVELTVRNCGNINSLFSLSIAKNLVNLRRLSIGNCSDMVKVVKDKVDEVERSPFTTFPKLSVLNLKCLPRLTSFCKGIQSIEFPLLTRMEIVECPNLKRIVLSTEENDHNHICSGAINRDADVSLHLFCKPQAAFGMLKTLTIDGCENTSSERSWSLWCVDQIPVNFFTGLVSLTVSNCGNIKSLFSPSIVENLVNLRYLTIESSCEMVKVIEDEDEVERSPFIKLEYLNLRRLPKLKSFCDWRCALHLPSLVRVYINECPEMERFSFGSLTTPNLQRIMKNGKDIDDYTKDLNDAVIWVGDSV